MLREPVRSRVVALAATALGAMSEAEVPAVLRKVARFTPAKRAKLGAADLLAALESEPLFRLRVTALAKGETPEELAAAAWLQQAEGWQEQVDALAAQPEPADNDALLRLAVQLEHARARSKEELARARAEAEETKAELAAVRRKLRETGSRVGRAELAEELARAELAQAQQALEAERAARLAEVKALQDRLSDAERAAGEARATVREGVKGDQIRLRLLLDAVVGAAQGLRRELALPPTEGRPGDSLAAEYAAPVPARQGREAEDPAWLEALLNVPTTHLLVDGYNVTKTGYGTLTLEAQRSRLLSGLGALAARTRAEVTVVFDGAEGTVPVALPAPRGVRLQFSRRGETADEVLRRFARNEPVGRPVVVVSSDKEVADGVRAVGGHAVPAAALVRLLDR
jgi:predicted RNA-binding protein with PIN domain